MPDFTKAETQLDPTTTTWFTQVLGTIETLDPDAYTALMTDDVELRLPDGSELRGREEVAAAFRASWPVLSSLLHHELNVWGDARQIVHEARVVSVTTDGQTVVSTSTSWIERNPLGQITSARVYG